MIKFTKTSRKAELEGTPIEYDDGFGNALGLKIARTNGNPHYQNELTRLMAPYRKKIEKGKDVGPEVAKKIINQVLAKEILLGWDESVLVDSDGNGIKYTQENALDLLTHDNDLRDFVIEQSENQENFLMKKE